MIAQYALFVSRTTKVIAHLLAVTVLLTGCVTTGPAIDENDPEFRSISDPKARRLLSRGDIEGAANRYTSLASKTSDPLLQQDYLLIAGEILYDRGLIDSGALKLAAIPQPLANSDLQHRYQILQGKNSLFNSRPDEALLQLPDPALVTSALHRARVFEVQAQSFRQMQLPSEELDARIALDELLEQPEVVDRNHTQIWQLLSTQSLTTLRAMTTNVRGDTYQGWIELALANASSGLDAQKRAANFSNWQTRFPEHPATARFVPALNDPAKFGGFTLAESSINQIAVLLPLSAEGIGSAAQAIRDGIAISYQNNLHSAKQPNIQFYDTSDASRVRSVYQSAVQDGADAIIGPLRKDAVAAIVSQRTIPVPTLTLNYVDSLLTGSVENLIQFGLAPEDEARAAANRALALNYKNAIVLQSDDSRGDRESRAFQEEMLLGGGDILHTAVLPVEDYDYSKQIRDSLLITQSDQRFKSLSNAIGKKLFFEPSVRDDLDVIFLAINLDQAKSVRPQLSFFRAGPIPKFGTSRVHTSDDDVRSNNDLNGIFFSDAPWALDDDMKKDPLYRAANKNFDEGMQVFSKLYALGIDSYLLINNLQNLVNPQAPPLQGYTGNLALSPDGKIRRDLMWAQYEDGLVKSVPSAVYDRPLPLN